MRPAFSNALYYPFIDIQNSDWLKTAVLFWDSISTIVPESMKEPYTNRDTQYLADMGFIRSIRVNSSHNSVVEIENEFIDLVESPECFNYFISSHSGKNHHIYDETSNRSKKEHRFFGEITQFSKSIIYAEKLSYKLRKRLNNFTGDTKCYVFEKDFARLYMIALANKISEAHSIALVTDNLPSVGFSNTIRYNTITPGRDSYDHRDMPTKHFEQGLLLDLIINDLRISPNTDLESIIKFKEKHRDELGLFRTQLARLTQGASLDQSIGNLRQEINDLYVNEFSPAYNNFKRALNSSKIKWFSDNALKVSLFFTKTTIMGLPLQQALLVGAGISLLVSAVSYSVNKKQVLKNSPYSYLMLAKEELNN